MLVELLPTAVRYGENRALDLVDQIRALVNEDLSAAHGRKNGPAYWVEARYKVNLDYILGLPLHLGGPLVEQVHVATAIFGQERQNGHMIDMLMKRIVLIKIFDTSIGSDNYALSLIHNP